MRRGHYIICRRRPSNNRFKLWPYNLCVIYILIIFCTLYRDSAGSIIYRRNLLFLLYFIDYYTNINLLFVWTNKWSLYYWCHVEHINNKIFYFQDTITYIYNIWIITMNKNNHYNNNDYLVFNMKIGSFLSQYFYR